jgi:hypothetical protein
LQMVWLMVWRRHVRMDGILVFWVCCTFKAMFMDGWYLSLFHIYGRNHRNGWYIDTRIGIDGIVSLLLFGTGDFRTDDILTGWMISELVAFRGCDSQVDDIWMWG